MKKIIIIFALVLSGLTASAQGIAAKSTPEQREYIQTLGEVGSDKEVMNFQSRMMVIDLKHEDTDGKFYPSSFTYKIQKAIPNHKDRLDVSKVREFMITYEMITYGINKQ